MVGLVRGHIDTPVRTALHSLGLVRNGGSHDESSVSGRLFLYRRFLAVPSGCVVELRRGVGS